MSSKERPLVSGTARKAQTALKPQKTAKKVYAPNPLVPSIMGGVIKPMMKLLSQLLVVAKATPLPRIELGNISDGMAHGTGPQEAPKNSYRI